MTIFAVNYWGSNPNDDNDDCWTGKDFATLAEAEAEFAKAPTAGGDGKHGCGHITDETAYIELDGPGVYKLRKNPAFDAVKVAKEAAADERAWQREIAMEAGMAFGCDGYNDAMGY